MYRVAQITTIKFRISLLSQKDPFRPFGIISLSHSLQPHGLYTPWNSLGQNTGVGGLSLLQGIFQTQGLNPGLPHWRQTLYQLGHKGSPRILEIPCGSAGEESAGFDPWVGKIPWRREQLPTPVFWPGEFHGLLHGIVRGQTQLSNFH